MRKLIILVLLCFSLTGCSLLPKILAPANTIPQETVKSQKKEVCTGAYRTDENGNSVCSKGYQISEQNYSQKERKMTFKEKIVAWINQFFGWFIVIIILLAIFCPSILVWIFSSIIKKHKKVIEQTVRGIQDFKTTGKDLPTALGLNQDTEVQNFIKTLKNKLDIK